MSDESQIRPQDGPATVLLPRLPGAGGRHRDESALAGWLREWGIVLASVVMIAVTLVTVAGYLVMRDAGPAPSVAGPPPVELAGPVPEATGIAPRSPAATRASAPPAAPIDRVASVAVAVQRQSEAGRLDPDAARNLLRRLNDIAGRLARGEHRKAAEKLVELRDKLTELRRAGRLTPAGYAALPDLEAIIAAIPADAERD